MGACCAKSNGYVLAGAVAVAAATIAASLADRDEPVAPEVVAQPEGEAELSPEMLAWIEAGTPGEHHEFLQRFVGDWTAEAKFQMETDGPWIESAGRMACTSIFDGRFVEVEYTGDFFGESFTGKGLFGYDNLKKAYVSTWIDSMSTMIYAEEGEREGDTLTMNAGFMGPMGEKILGKHVHIFEGDDTLRTEWHEKNGEGEWRHSGTIVYTRN